jgi:hypothetical protein
MTLRRACAAFLVIVFALPAFAAPTRTVSVLWDSARQPDGGTITIDRGRLAVPGPVVVTSRPFALPTNRPAKLEVAIIPTPVDAGLPTLVTVNTPPQGFTFRLEDVDTTYPIFLPALGVIVTDASDTRPYAEIATSIRQRGTTTQLQRIAAAPEASFAAAAATSHEVRLQTWLGVSRDIRLFRLDENLESFQPRFAGYDVPLPELRDQPATYAFQFGRGRGARDTVTRSLDEGTLPILRGYIDDDAIHYDVTAFASLERSSLMTDNIRGTDYLVADAFGHGHMFTPEQKAAEQQRHNAELSAPEEVVLHVRAVATNRSSAPAYAFLNTAVPIAATPIAPKPPPWKFEPTNGFSLFANDRVFAVSKLDGKPLPAEENSVLLRPGASAVIEFIVPHRPIARERAVALAAQSFNDQLAAARAFWRGKLASAAQWRLPEPRIERMTQAGLLHLDLITYGREPGEPLLPAIGVYTAIGSESAPIIQYFDSMGWHDQAARALDFFLAKQHADGFIQNFNGYMLETGAVLWSLGEHYRYTRDDAWLARVQPHVVKACEYLLQWRERNQRTGTPDDGDFGLLDGKTADPDDPYRSFMLNGYAYLGLARAAEMYREAAPHEAARWSTAAEALKTDLRRALAQSLERGPVVALGDGTWSRAAAPWTNYRGPVMLHADGGRWFTHGTMTARDSLLGPLQLVFQEVVAPGEPMAAELLTVHSELMTRDNVAFSQPYYSRHPWIHLRRGETKPFLQAWYATVAAMADRETFTFNEHLFPVTAHKTHEEAWFLMETRWMLYLEEGNTLRLLTGTPRAYFDPGATIEVQNAGTYFGTLSFRVRVSDDGRTTQVVVDCAGPRRPATVTIRVPDPRSRRARNVTGGVYSADNETVRLDSFTGHAEITLSW